MWNAFQVEPASNRSTRKGGQLLVTTNNANNNIIDVLKNSDNVIERIHLKLAEEYIGLTLDWD